MSSEPPSRRRGCRYRGHDRIVFPMSHEPAVIVAKEHTTQEGTPPERAAARGLSVVLVAAAVVAGGMLLLGTETAPPAGTGGLESPVGAAVGIQGDQRPSSTTTLPEIATGWRRLDLPGEGTIVGLAHGEAGWMAITDAALSTVTTSEDGRVWVTRTFPGSIHGQVEAMVTADRLVIVDSDLDRSAGARSWISGDGGASWESALFTNGFARVDDLASSGRRILAGGATAVSNTELIEEDGTTSAAVWEYTPGGWAPLGFSRPPGNRSTVAALAAQGDDVMAFGRVDGRAAAWRLVDSSLVPEPVSVPVQAERGTFSSVTRAIDGSWVAAFDTISEVVYARSTDLRSWTLLTAGLDEMGATTNAATRLGVVYVGEQDQTYRVADRAGVQEIRYRYAEAATGFDPDRHTAVVASDGELIVMGGGTHDPAIWLRGLEGGRVGVVAPPVPDTGRWQSRQAFGAGFWGEDPQPLQVVALADEYLIVTPQDVWRTPDPAGTRPMSDAITADAVFTTERGVFLTDATSRLFRLTDGRWIPEEIEISVAGVTGTQTSLMVFGWDGDGKPVIGRNDDGTWRIDSPGQTTIYPQAAAGGVVFGFEADRSPEDGGMMTRDGVTWSPIDLGAVRGLDGGIPFLVVARSSSSTAIELLDDGLSIEVPSIDPVEVVRAGGIVRLRGSDGLWETRDGGASWTSYPIGIEYRLTGSIRLIPTEEPTLLMAGRDAYRILTFAGS